MESRMDLEVAAEAVHNAYLTTCAKLGWDVKPSNQVPYAELSEDSKELDRASVRAVVEYLASIPARSAPEPAPGEGSPSELDTLRDELEEEKTARISAERALDDWLEVHKEFAEAWKASGPDPFAKPSSPSQDSAAAEKEFSDPGEAESPSQWAYRLGLKLDRWIPWNGVDNFQRIENAVLQFVEMKKAPARPSQDSQEVGEYPIMLVDNLRVCEGCLKGVGQMCHTPGCAFIRSRSLDMDVRESILLNGGTIRPEVAALSQSPKGAAVVGDQGREWWLKTYRKNGEEIAYQIRETAPINSRGAVIKQGWVHVREVVEAAGGESGPSAPKTGLRGAPRQEDGATLDAIRPVIEDIEDSARVAAGGFQGQPTYWTFNVFEDIRKKARALLELLPSKTKPAPGDVGSAGGDKA